MSSKAFLTLLKCEIAAARLEAIFVAEPSVGRLWRIEAAYGEAVRSVGLEDVRLNEGDLIARMTVNRAGEGDPRGLEQAAAILRILRQPGDVLSQPVPSLRRIEAAAAPIGVRRDEPEVLTDAELAEIVEGTRHYRGAPIAGALRASADYAWRTGRHSPVAERLIFSAVEGALRAESFGVRQGVTDDAPTILGRVDAHWIVTPSTTLTRRGFRIWSPLRPDTMVEFAGLVAESLAWDLGQVGQLRRHVELLGRAGEGRRGRARHADFARWLPEHPVFSSAMIMDGIGVTRRTALALIEDFVDQGVVASITPRRTARLWATASLSDRLKVRSSRARSAEEVRVRLLSATPPPAADAAPGFSGLRAAEPARRKALREENREGMDKAMADLDRLLAEADGILGGIRTRN